MHIEYQLEARSLVRPNHFLFIKTLTAAAPHQPHQQSLVHEIFEGKCVSDRVRKSMCNNGYELRFTVEYYLNIPQGFSRLVKNIQTHIRDGSLVTNVLFSSLPTE